jgi:hypothetical protein
LGFPKTAQTIMREAMSALVTFGVHRLALTSGAV